VARIILDAGILEKIADRRQRAVSAIRVMVSKKAAKHGISPQAALVILATEHNVPTAVFQRMLDAGMKSEIRTALQSAVNGAISSREISRHSRAKAKSSRTERPVSDKQVIKRAVALLIQDPQLRSRCTDILLARSSFDRPINQATQILEDRIRRKAEPTARLVGENLVGYAFKEDLSETVLRVASNDPDDQRGLTRILRGIVPAFRNATHHHIVDTYSQADALSICFFVDLLLRAVDKSVKAK
jgi:uncharacterized protein (TIGR02391 family)